MPSRELRRPSPPKQRTNSRSRSTTKPKEGKKRSRSKSGKNGERARTGQCGNLRFAPGQGPLKKAVMEVSNPGIKMCLEVLLCCRIYTWYWLYVQGLREPHEISTWPCHVSWLLMSQKQILDSSPSVSFCPLLRSWALGFSGPKRVPKKRLRSAPLPRAAGPGPGSRGAGPGPGSRGVGPGLGRRGGGPGCGWGDLGLTRFQRPGSHRVAPGSWFVQR